ncbi:MAG: hypothetical protein GY835_17775 [bacterium]|nr:hypothetical protein [bacterium]
MKTRAHSTSLLLLFVFSLTLFTTFTADAAVYTRTLPVEEAVDPSGAMGRWLTKVADTPAEDRALKPGLTWWWALADGERIVEAELTDIREEILTALSGNPRVAPMVGTEGSLLRKTGDTALWPAEFTVSVSEPRTLHGRRFQAITVEPLRYAAGNLHELRAADIRVVTETSAAIQARVQPLRPDFPLRARVLESLGGMLLNPSVLPSGGERALGGGGFPTDTPNIDGAAVDMVIITIDEYADLCEPYAEFKTSTGVPTVVRTVEWIQERYPFGCDRPEMIRNFIIDAYSKWSIRYVLLVGDSESLPPRYAYSTIFSDDVTSPTDMYFACLDGDWNADNDANWAEIGDPEHGVPGDEADFLAEISVGRLPVNDRDDCTVILEKSRLTQVAGNTPYQDRILMMGEVLFPLEYPTDPNIIIDGAAYCETIYTTSTDENHSVVRLYENTADYPGSEPLSVASARDSLNNGWGVVIHNGHGARQTMSVGSGSLGANIVNHLENGNNTFLLYMVNCTAAAFDFNCISELFLSNPSGGAHAVIGSTRESFANVSAVYMEHFFEILQSGGDTMRLGDVYKAGMTAMEPNTSSNNGYRWAHCTFVLLGDPSNWQHYKRADPMRIDMSATHELAAGPYRIFAFEGDNAPVADALVTISKGSEEYQSGLTDVAGEIYFDLQAETVGSYDVRISRRNYKLASGSFTTLSSSAPLVSIDLITIDDTTGGGVFGNGNGIAERGETVRLAIDLQNRGEAAAGQVGAQLTSIDPDVVILADTASYGDIGAGTGSAVGDPFLVQILQPQDDHILPFELTITADEGSFQDDFFLEAAVPLLTFDRTVIDDSGGNDDGVLDVGETADLRIHLRNTGRGYGQAIGATLESVAGGSIAVTQPTAGLGDLAPLAADLGPAVFTVNRIDEEPTDLRLLLTDALGQTDTLLFNLNQPVGTPDNLTFVHGADVTRLHLAWEPLSDMNLAGYSVLRALDEGGPFVEVSGDWVLHSSFEDSGLEPYSSYWYRIQPLSFAGIRGTMSLAYLVTTNPAQKNGWPVACSKELAGTPIVADVDNDGVLEIIVGADVLNGFNSDGSELDDGDGDQMTSGPLDDVGSNLFCSLAADDLDRSGGVEVIACSWDTGEVLIYEFTDTPTGARAHMASGWPKVVPHGYGIWSTPAVGDVDGDGVMEIFLTDVGGHLLAWHYDGSELIDGDDNPGTDGIFKNNMGGWIRSSPALADLDNDRVMEVIIGTPSGQLQVYKGDGSRLTGFPYTGCEAIFSSPSVGDIDGDGLPEIVFAAEDDSLHVVNHDGTPLAGWPIYLYNDNWALTPSVALADITGDGRQEMFVCSIQDYHIMEVGWVDYRGFWLPGWPLHAAFSTQSSPIVGDIDGDGDLETILGNEFASIEAWHHDGTPVAGFPLVTGDYVRATPTLADVDEDGFLDMVLPGWDKNLYVWEFPVAHDPESTPWYTFLHNQRRTNNNMTIDWIVGIDDDELNVPGMVRLDSNWPNPFNPKTNIRFTIDGDVNTDVQLVVFDIRGRQVRSLVDEALPPGVYSRAWDGCDDAGHPLASGIYFARLQMGDRVDSRKMTLLK